MISGFMTGKKTIVLIIFALGMIIIFILLTDFAPKEQLCRLDFRKCNTFWGSLSYPILKYIDRLE